MQRSYEAALEATVRLNVARAMLPPDHPAHQELDQASLAVQVALDSLRPRKD